MKIVLIIPPYDLMAKGYGVKKKIRAGFLLPLGLGYLAAPLLKSGHQVKIIDSPPLNYQNDDVIKDIRQFCPDLIGVSALSSSAEEAYSLIRQLKLEFPNLPLVFGGAHVNCFAEKVTKDVPMVDCLVYGEGEITLKRIVDSLEQTGKIAKNIRGTWVKDEQGNFFQNPPAEIIENLDDFLSPSFELYDLSIYQPMPLQALKLPQVNLITSRGCPWGRCTFCFESGKASQKYRRHSVQRVIAEIKLLINNYGVKEITFWDDNFLIGDRWVYEFCDALDREKIVMPWSVQSKVNSINRPLLTRAKKSGLWSILFGFETGNEDLLLRIKKGATLDQARQAVKYCHELGILVRGSFMLALPGENKAKAQKTIDFAKELNPHFVHFFLTHPEWGTELYDDAIKSGRFIPSYRGRNEVSYIPDGYKDAAEIRAVQKKAYQSFYFRPSFFWKHLKRIDSWEIVKQYYFGVKYIFGILGW